jgi:hypothetical protein
MSKTYKCCLWIFLGLTVSAARAQATPPPVDATDQQGSASGSGADRPAQADSSEVFIRTGAPEAAPSYAPALDGTGLILMDHSVSSRLLIGAEFSGGYDTRPEESPGAPGSAISVVSPFIGLQVNRENVQYVFQYLPTFTRYADDRYQGGSLHSGMVNMSGEAGERWNWELHGLGMHGQDSLRLLAPQATVAVGDIPGTNPSAASFRGDSGTVTYIDFGSKLSYRLREHDTVSAVLSNSYGTSTSSSTPGDTIVGVLRGVYSHDVSARLRWMSYAEAARYYGELHCWSYGPGLGFLWRPGERSFLDVSGGPQFNSSTCGKQQNVSYRVAYAARLTQRSQAYLTSQRQMAGVYVGPGVWEQSVTAGYQYLVTSTNTLGADYGYVDETVYKEVTNYKGTYVGAAYNHKLPRSLTAGISYRYFNGGLSGSTVNRNTVLFSLTWLPTGAKIFQ